VGLDFLSHPFWDKYLDFEERVEAQDRIFAILSRIIHIPMHQYARYFEKYRNMAARRHVVELAPEAVLLGFREEITQGGTLPKGERELDQELRTRLDAWHLELFNRTQAETTKRWTYEQEIKRPYYHVNELDDTQLTNWRKYLDFEEGEGDYVRTKFLYERCLVTTANYEEFWMRYARWMFAQSGKSEEVRNIYQRASCIYIPIAQPTIRLLYANFEESEGKADVAAAVHEAILDKMPDHIEAIVSLSSLDRRQYGVQAAINRLNAYINSEHTSSSTAGALISEWARMVWRSKGSADDARQIYLSAETNHPGAPAFWINWLEFEMMQPSSEDEEVERYQRVKYVFDRIRGNALLPPELVKALAERYFAFLKERGGKEAMKEFMQLDREINGPMNTANGTTDAPAGKGLGLAFQKSGVIAANPASGYPAQQAATPTNGWQ
jgi:pre-mRNA-processing factor 39